MGGSVAGRYDEAVKHVGHRIRIVDEGPWVRLACADCGVTLAGVNGDEDEFLYRRWLSHADPRAEGLNPARYATMDPDSEGFPEHWVVCVAYGHPGEPANVAVECEHCGEILEDWDAESDEG